MYLGLSPLQSDCVHGEAVRVVVEVEGEAPHRYGDDEMEGRGASVSTSDVVGVVAAAGPREEEAGHLGRLNLDPREEGVDHQILTWRAGVGKADAQQYLVLFSMQILGRGKSTSGVGNPCAPPPPSTKSLTEETHLLLIILRANPEHF